MAGHWLAYLSTEATVAPVAALWNDVVVPAPGVCPGFRTGEACVVCGLCCEGRGKEGRGRRGRGEEGWGGMGGEGKRGEEAERRGGGGRGGREGRGEEGRERKEGNRRGGRVCVVFVCSLATGLLVKPFLFTSSRVHWEVVGVFGR